MMPKKLNLSLHLAVGASAYIFFGVLDAYLTIQGMAGDTTLEGNPVFQTMMSIFGLIGGLVVEKALVLVLAIVVAVLTFKGIDQEADWVYYLALTRMTRNWMKRKKRYWIALMPIYVAAVAQGLAAASWFYLLTNP